MKNNSIFPILTFLAVSFFSLNSRAIDITATNSGSWGDTNVWDSGTVPGINDDVDVEAPFNITVETNEVVQYMYGGGTVTMGPNSTLTIVGDSLGGQGTQGLADFETGAAGNTVVYTGNPFWAKHQNYYNLVLGGKGDFFNGDIGVPGDGIFDMTIAGDMTLTNGVILQQGTNIGVNGNLILGHGCSWDCSSYEAIVLGNTTIGGTLFDADGALGTNIFNNITVSTNGQWNLTDVVQWSVRGSLTNNGRLRGIAYSSISFDGTGTIGGITNILIPTMTVSGTYTIANQITLITNTPTLNGTLVFDIANPKQIILLTNAGTALYYSGNLNVINSGPAPASGATFKFFGCTNGFGGAFDSTSYPTLPAGLSWDDSTLLTSGSISVIGGIVGSPTLSFSKSGGTLTLSWDSATYPGYSVQAQTNKAGIGTSWSSTGSGTTSPFMIAINPTNPPVFFRLSNP